MENRKNSNGFVRPEIAIVHALALDGRRTRRELAAQLGLGPVVATDALDRLLRLGVVRQGPAALNTPGRPPHQYWLEATCGYVAAVHIHPGGVGAAAFDLEWGVRARASIQDRLLERSSAQIVDAAAAAIEQLVASGGVERERCLAVGCGVWGSALDGRAATLFWPYRRDLRDVPLADALSERFGMPVTVDDGVRNLARGLQHRQVAGSAADFLLLTETGASALVLRGSVYLGSAGLGGELGHVVVDPDGPPCQCGSRGCLLAVAGAHALLRRMQAAEGPGLHPALRALLENGNEAGGNETRDVTTLTGRASPEMVSALIAAAGDGDRLAARLLGEVGTGIGVAVAVAVNLLGVETAVVQGELVGRAALTQEALLRAVRLHLVEPLAPRLQVHFLGRDRGDGLLGAALNAFNYALTQHPLAAGARQILLGGPVSGSGRGV